MDKDKYLKDLIDLYGYANTINQIDVEMWASRDKFSFGDSIPLDKPDRKKELLSILEKQPIEILETMVLALDTFKS